MFTFLAVYPFGEFGPVQVTVPNYPKRNTLYASGWEPLVTSLHVTGQTDDPNEIHVQNLFKILAKFYEFGADAFTKWQEKFENMEQDIAPMLGKGALIAYNRTFQEAEWHYSQLWPHSVNFGDLCYSSDPSVDVEVTWRFKECKLRQVWKTLD